MQRFLVLSGCLEAEVAILPQRVAQQLVRVLRARAGERIVLFTGDGRQCMAVLEEVGARQVTARLYEWSAPEVELPAPLEVALAVLKGEKLDWVVQKLTELGVTRISLLRTVRTIGQAGDERWERRLERYQRIAVEAAEQSGRVRVPEVLAPRTMAEVLAAVLRGEDARSAERCWILDPCANPPLAAACSPDPRPVLLLVGPEGGFSDEEIAEARSLGAVPISLGPRILRAETAAIAAAALVTGAWQRDH